MRRLMTAVVAVMLAAACGGSEGGERDALADEFASAQPCPQVGELIPEDFDNCLDGDTLTGYQSFDCTDGRTLIWITGIGHGFTGSEMEAGEWPQETIDECNA